jgi:hypothetical protein
MSAGEKGKQGGQGASWLREVLAGILTGRVRRKIVGKMNSTEKGHLRSQFSNFLY